MLFLATMAIELRDTLTMDGARITGDGYLVASVKAARTGIQIYGGREVDPDNSHGLRDKATVRVYRPESEVFKVDTLNSFTSIPLTNDHPPEAVTADNWRKYAVGNTGEEWARDGQTMRLPIIMKDAAAIRAVEAGKRELSCGYTCDLAFTPGRTDDGLEYDAIQTNIRGNHLATVDRARGGHELRIGDSDMTTKPVTITIDGASHTVELSDAAAILVGNLQTALAKATADRDTAQTAVGTLTATVSTKDGEIAVLKQQATDAVMTPAKLDAAVTARAKVIDAAKKIFPAIVVDGKTDAEIRKEAVKAKLGDAAVAMDDNAIIGAFTAYAASNITTVDTLRQGIKEIPIVSDADRAKPREAYLKMVADMTNPEPAKAN